MVFFFPSRVSRGLARRAHQGLLEEILVAHGHPAGGDEDVSAGRRRAGDELRQAGDVVARHPRPGVGQRSSKGGGALAGIQVKSN